MTTNNSDVEIPVLDHGYVKYIEHWGSDERIIESARMSTDGSFRGWGTGGKPGDERLLRYLWGHQHTSPFEQAGATFEIQAPIMVFREHHRHRTQSYSELSGRYTEMPNLHYIPSADRIRPQAKGNQQASSYEPLPTEIISEWQRRMADEQKLIYENYQWALSVGIARETARMDTPISRYSRMRASANLLNWLRFLTLRTDKVAAQQEIVLFAEALLELLHIRFPRTLDLWGSWVAQYREFLKGVKL